MTDSPSPRIYIFDTTLRDGAQTSGIDFSPEDKMKIACALDNFGIDFINPFFIFSSAR